MNWRPIESAPRDGTEILGFPVRGGPARVIWWDEDGEYWRDDLMSYIGDPVRGVTQWMPTPEPSK